MKHNKKWIVYLVMAAIIVSWAALSADQDCYFREFNQSSLTRFHNDSLSADEAGEYSGTLAETPAVSLPAGDYKITMNYGTDTDSNTFYITSENGAFDNMEGALLSAPSCREVKLHLEEDAAGLTVSLFYNGIGRLDLKNVVIESEHPVCTDRFLIGAAALALLAVWVFLDFRKSPGRRTYLWLLGLSLFAAVPFINGYLIEGQDMSFHLNRIEQIYLGLKDGQFPVRIQPGTLDGYGYGAPLMYPELFLYLPALLRLLGGSAVTAAGLFLFLIHFATAGIMYFCAGRLLSSRFGAMACSLFYTLAIYRLVNCYTRFALGELLAMAFMPLVVYGLFEVLKGEKSRWPYLTAGICGVLQSHVISTVFAALITGIFCLIFIRRLLEGKRIFALAKAGVWSVILNLWFLAPFLHMFGQELNTASMRLQFEKITISFPQLFQIFPLSQGDTSFVGESLGGKMSFGIGIALIFFSACCLYGLVTDEGFCSRRNRTVPCLSLGLGVFFVLLTTQWFPWSVLFRIPLAGQAVSFLQFPWRFLSCASVFLTLCAGAGAVWMRERWGSPHCVMAAALILAVLPAGYYMDDFSRSAIYLMKEEIVNRNDIAGGEYLYAGTDTEWLKSREAVPLSDDPGFSLVSFEKNGTHMTMTYQLERTAGIEEAAVELPVSLLPRLYCRLGGRRRDGNKAAGNIQGRTPAGTNISSCRKWQDHHNISQAGRLAGRVLYQPGGTGPFRRNPADGTESMERSGKRQSGGGRQEEHRWQRINGIQPEKPGTEKKQLPAGNKTAAGKNRSRNLRWYF